MPATGKTTIATSLSRSLAIPVYTKDHLEAAVVRRGLAAADELNGVGYELLAVLALDALAREQSCILDCIAAKSRTVLAGAAEQESLLH